MTDTVIVGSGIIGLSTAFYLSFISRAKETSQIHLVDSSEDLFKCASGLAGGFLASNWFSPASALLGALSYQEHASLARQFDGARTWGYSSSMGSSLSLPYDNDEDAVGGSGADWLLEGTSRASGAAGEHEEEQGAREQRRPAWIALPKGAALETIGREGEVAQIDPLRLCRFLLAKCFERGVELHQPARPVSVSKDGKGLLSGLTIAAADGSETQIPCTRIVLAAGIWTSRVYNLLFPRATAQIPVSALAGHSLLLKTPRWSAEEAKRGCHAVFATDVDGFAPELFSRDTGEIYIAGLNTTLIPSPELASNVEVVPESIEKMKKVAIQLLGLEENPDELTVVREGLCFRPVTSSGRPIIGRLSNKQLGEDLTKEDEKSGVFVATGHGAWGISQSLGTGLVLAELMEGRPTSANISSLAPK